MDEYDPFLKAIAVITSLVDTRSRLGALLLVELALLPSP